MTDLAMMEAPVRYHRDGRVTVKGRQVGRWQLLGVTGGRSKPYYIFTSHDRQLTSTRQKSGSARDARAAFERLK